MARARDRFHTHTMEEAMFVSPVTTTATVAAAASRATASPAAPRLGFGRWLIAAGICLCVAGLAAAGHMQLRTVQAALGGSGEVIAPAGPKRPPAGPGMMARRRRNQRRPRAGIRVSALDSYLKLFDLSWSKIRSTVPAPSVVASPPRVEGSRRPVMIPAIYRAAAQRPAPSRPGPRAVPARPAAPVTPGLPALLGGCVPTMEDDPMAHGLCAAAMRARPRPRSVPERPGWREVRGPTTPATRSGS